MGEYECTYGIAYGGDCVPFVAAYGGWRFEGWIRTKRLPGNPKGLLARAWLRFRWAFKRRAADG